MPNLDSLPEDAPRGAVNIADKLGSLVAYHQDPETIRLVGDRYLVEILEVSNLTESGIEIIDDRLSRAWEPARVLVVGNGYRIETHVYHDMHFEKGAIIAIERLAGRDITLGGKKFRLVNQTATFFEFTSKDAQQLKADYLARVGAASAAPREHRSSAGRKR